MSDRGVGAVGGAQVGGVAWGARDHAAMGLPVSFDLPVGGHLDALADLAAGAAYLEWRRYQHAAALHTEIVVPEEDRDERAVDAFAQCAARVATTLSVSQYVAERLLDDAVALRDRLPRVAECLRDGVVSANFIRAIVSRTELIHGRLYQGLVDADIAAALRKPGTWSTARVRDLCDQMVYRRDPDAVRERREEALKGRCFFTEAGLDGMGTVGATVSAERAAVVARVVERLAAQVCKHDSRTKTARASDALFALVKHAPFGCDCARPECTFTVVDADEVAANAARIVIHVVADTTTLTGPVPANTTTAAVDEAAAADAVPESESERELVDGVGFVAGLGIISGAHVRDLAADPDTLIRPLGDGTDTPLPATQPADPYRPSAALDANVRARDQYCTWPGCNKPAWDGDLDHITEYDHTHPENGGKTTATGLGAKCRFHHLLKTFGDFVDDQYDDPDHPGRIVRTVTIPEGRTVLGPAHTGFDTHPGLDMIVFGDPPASGTNKQSGEREPTRPAPRT
ncbi:DUF222 domain-containing protein, partial [Rhodococcoides corynebacterioides]